MVWSSIHQPFHTTIWIRSHHLSLLTIILATNGAARQLGCPSKNICTMPKTHKSSSPSTTSRCFNHELFTLSSDKATVANILQTSATSFPSEKVRRSPGFLLGGNSRARAEINVASYTETLEHRRTQGARLWCWYSTTVLLPTSSVSHRPPGAFRPWQGSSSEKTKFVSKYRS